MIRRDAPEHLQLRIRGAVQGVGFRPFVYRLARSLELSGRVWNTAQGVTIDVEGPEVDLQSFRRRLESETPPMARIHGLETAFLDTVGYGGFQILGSEKNGKPQVVVLPDIAICIDCRTEIDDPTNRRYRYPFTNCTNCGPRFSIIRSMPYDRQNTTMHAFDMCPACRAEYDDPLDRRFHAQPNACHVCGPQLTWWRSDGVTLSTGDRALEEAIAALGEGAIVAVKGLGGFHLVVDAQNSVAITALRLRKRREAKPLAVMFPDTECVRNFCLLSDQETRLLQSPEAPITLLQRRGGPSADLADEIAPGSPILGVLLPYTPLHHLLMTGLGRPVVATSGNLSNEPICIDEQDALQRLTGIADHYLVHDRPILRHVDDSVAHIVAGREQILRRARGFAPMPLPYETRSAGVLGVGAHLKSVVALALPQGIVGSQHIGDLETEAANAAFEMCIDDLSRLHDQPLDVIACDQHPDYRSTRYAQTCGLPVVEVQHHHAHLLSCMADNALDPPVTGICWDGTGIGSDGTVWGGEVLTIAHDLDCFTREAHLRPFPLPGGDRAVVEPRRAALGALYAIHGDRLFTEALHERLPFDAAQVPVLARMLQRRINCPITSSAGRLFDAVAALLGVQLRADFEAQAAMQLEFAIAPGVTRTYDVAVSDTADGPMIFDWSPMLKAIVSEVDRGVDTGTIAATFHNTMAQIVVEGARRASYERVLLTGGCFQNRYLADRAAQRLGEEGFRPYQHQRVPPNDGGIAVGQVIAALSATKGGKHVSGGSR